jgi:hypothetical protein
LFALCFTEEAERAYRRLQVNSSQVKRYKAVKKTLQFMADNPRHPSLRTHEYTSLKGPGGEKVYEAYAEQNTPAAYRVFWHYGPSRGDITIIAITPHP